MSLVQKLVMVCVLALFNFSMQAQSVIWHDDFTTSNHWIFQNDSNEWRIDTVLSANLLAQGVDTTIVSASGGNFAYIDSDETGSSATQDALLIYDAAINCAQYSNVQLTFVNYLYQFQEQRFIEVSVDTGNSWSQIPVLEEFGFNSSSPNGYRALVNISAIAANKPNVQIRFRYVGSNDWFWAIDDVTLVSCDGVTINVTDTVVDSLAVGTVNIGVTGGIPPYEFKWIGPNGFESNAQNLSGLIDQGDYHLVVSDSLGCSTSHTSTVGGVVNVFEINERLLRIYPNPSKGEVFVESAVNSDQYIQVVDLKGVVLRKYPLGYSGKLDVSGLLPGVYLVQLIKNANISRTVKLVLN